MGWAKLGAAIVSVLIGLYFALSAVLNLAAVLINLSVVLNFWSGSPEQQGSPTMLVAALLSLLFGILCGAASWFFIRWIPRRLFPPVQNPPETPEQPKRAF